MRKKIKELEQISAQLEPNAATRTQWNLAAQNYADDFLNQLNALPAYDLSEDNAKEILKEEIGTAKPIDDLLNVIKKYVDRTGINPASGKHFGYIPGGGVFPTALGDYLAAVSNRYAGIFFANPGAVRMENQLLRWLCDLMGYPSTALGNLASGGSIANLIAITTARDFHDIRAKDVEKSVIYLTPHIHHCVQKALRIAGLREAKIRYVPMDDRFRMKAEVLKEMVKQDKEAGGKPFLVVASAGTTDIGAIDPLNDIADVAEAHNLWFHVDAAYGGFFILADIENEDGSTLKSQFSGIERSDSLAIDPHKGLFLSYGIGVVLMKNVQAQLESHHYKANYMQDAQQDFDELSPADLSPELTKHFRGLRMWLPLQLYGIEPFKAALEEKILLARYFYKKIQVLGFEVGPYPDLSVVTYRYVPEVGEANTFNKKLLDYLHRDGRIFVSSTTINGAYWLRLAVSSFRSHLKEVDLYLEILQSYLLKKTKN